MFTLDFPLKLKEINLQTQQNKSKWYMKINPNGTVPTWVDENGIICESADIFKYVLRKYDHDLVLYGEEGSKKRQAIEKFVGTTWGVESELHVIEIWHHTVQFPFFMKNANILAHSMTFWPDIAKTLKENLGDNPYFSGDEFGAADISLGYLLDKAYLAGLLDVAEHKPLLDFYNRIRVRPSFIKLTGAKFDKNLPGPTLYHFPQTHGVKVLWLQTMLDFPLHIKEVNIVSNEHKSKWYLQVNPKGTVPALVDGDVVLSDSHEIFKYLLEKYDKFGTYGGKEGSPRRKALNDILGSAWSIEAENHVIGIWQHSVILPSMMRNKETLQEHMKFWPDIAKEFIRILGDKPYFGGNTFSPIDCSIGYMITNAFSAHLLDPPDKKALLDYYNRIKRRPSHPKVFVRSSSCTIL
jgi:glutathione S-transferase